MTNRERAAKIDSAIRELKRTREGYTTHPNGPHWVAGLATLKAVTADLRAPVKTVPNLGPVLEDGLPMLLLAPTHNTDGVPFYPAFDTGFGQAGRWVIAPEALTITRQSGAAGGDAVYARGASKIEYWIGHIGVPPQTGRTFRRGERIARVADQRNTDHVHWGLDTRPLTGESLRYGANGNGPDYTWGSPTIGAQLTKMLAV